MPHIITKKHNSIQTPSHIDGVFFDFIAHSPKEDKICVRVEAKTFLLTKLEKNGNDLIKLDVTTKVAPIILAKKALHAYIKLSKCEVISSNITIHTTKLEPQKEYLKDINYFVDDFHTSKEICVEVGFGSGRHLLYQAKTNKDKIYIGLEIHTPSIEQVLKQIRIEEIENIYIVNYDARLFLEFIESNSLSQIFVHFPVPWDKKPHRRVMSKEFIDESLRVLKIDGTLELRTDSPLYYEYSKELYESYTQKSTIVKNQSLEVSSKYEDRWKRMGKDIWDLTIYSDTNSPSIKLDTDFIFHVKNRFNFSELQNLFTRKPLVKDGYMVHFTYSFELSDKSGLIHISMGSFNKPFCVYLLVEDKNINYFVSRPVPTSANHKAHKLIESIFESGSFE